MTELTTRLLKEVFSHLVLPPKLPGKPFENPVLLLHELGRRLQKACVTLHPLVPGKIWNTLISSLNIIIRLNQDSLSRESLLEAFHLLAKGDNDNWLALHVLEQNAALLIHKDIGSQTVIFEAFEASAPAAIILQSSNALKWDFPGRAAEIRLRDFSDTTFQENLSDFLEQSSSTAFDRFAARAKKGEKAVVEVRDTPSPALISEMLMSLLEGMGNLTQVRRVHKRVRDDVVLEDSALPWRRSPYWLVLRVAVQRMLSSIFHDDIGTDRCHFKFIICMVLAQLLNDSVGISHPEQTLMLQAKLCRRLAKLESEKSQASASLRSVYEGFFEATHDFFKKTVTSAGDKVTNAWEEYKKGVTRKIPRLPTRILDNDTILRLSNSGKTLNWLLSQKLRTVHRITQIDQLSLGSGSISQVNELATCCSTLIDYEDSIKRLSQEASSDQESKCEKLSGAILNYLELAQNTYNGESQLMSRYLLNLFELWAVMDEAATAACPILLKYHPMLVPQALDILCFSTTGEMVRLLAVQKYLAKRVKTCGKKYGTIFDRPSHAHSFAAEFVRSTKPGSSMLDIGAKIDAASTLSKTTKVNQLNTLMAQYNRLTEAIQKGVCTCTREPDGTLNIHGCKKCWQKRSRKRLKIGIHEDFLPLPTPVNNRVQRDAILFELAIPQYLMDYRTTTWKLILLGSQALSNSENAPVIHLTEIKQLEPFWVSKPSSVLMLASRTKSFTQTHYSEMKLPKREEEILLPFGPNFSFYDSENGIWFEDLPSVPWYHHLLGSWLPRSISNPFEKPPQSTDNICSPSSYEIAANEVNCPPGMSTHEFSAYQRVLSGHRQRWLVLLVELGATNMNFSSCTTMSLINYISLQAGPYCQKSDFLRESHFVFQDYAFCQRMDEQLHKRLEVLAANWRETACMSVVITLGLRLYTLCPRDFKPKVFKLIQRIRAIISTWLTLLRDEVRSTEDGGVVYKAAEYAFWAALLCRQTFAIYLHDQGFVKLDEENACHFFRASIALSENLLVNLDQLSLDLKYLLKRDLLMSYSMRDLIQTWATSYSSALTDAIDETWVDVGSSRKRIFSTWKSLPSPDNSWLVSRTSATKTIAPQTVHYHRLQGHLLVDGKPLGRLPLEMRENASVQELFGRQHLLTRPSGLVGMEYQLVNDVHGHEIHFGSRDGAVLIRALFKGSLIEHVSRDIFREQTGVADLPSGLVDECVHWLNLNTGELQMRQKPQIWKEKWSNWILDVRRRQAIRKKARSRPILGGKATGMGSILIDPHSKVGSQIAGIFQGFEDVDKLTIYRPLAGSRYWVELKRLEVSFFVNIRGLLQSYQLHSEIDPIQDAGTLHGLTSQLVLRNVSNHRKRSVLVPIGAVYWEQQDIHTSVKVKNEGTYARFHINQVLGRLDCASEPLLLYLKALLHAMTSFPIPDGLTGRTGSEEARHCLIAASSQPWTPLQSPPQRILSMLERLGPRRHYYPPGSKIYQKVIWDHNLTMNIQHEILGTLVANIRQQSQKLETLQISTDTETEPPIEDVRATTHLHMRGIIRRQLYERVSNNEESKVLSLAAQDTTYRPRDRDSTSKGSCKVYRAIKALQDRNDGVPKLVKLEHLLRKRDVIGGFQHSSNTLDVQMILQSEIVPLWGSFVQACRSHGLSNSYITHFMMALLAFGEQSDINLIMWLVTQAKRSELGYSTTPPQQSLFIDFTVFEKPQTLQLRKLIISKQMPYQTFLTRIWKKQRHHKEPLEETMYESHVLSEADQIANLLINQWPAFPSSPEEFEGLTDQLTLRFFDINKAWMGLKPEMQRLLGNQELSAYLLQLDVKVEQLYESQDVITSEAQNRIWKSTPGALALTEAKAMKHPYQVPRLTAGLMTKSYVSNPSIVARMAERQIGKKRERAEQLLAPSAARAPPPEIAMLRGIIQPFLHKGSARDQYMMDLEASLDALMKDRVIRPSLEKAARVNDVSQEIAAAWDELDQLMETIRFSLFQDEADFAWLHAGNLWPCISRVALLEQLRSHTPMSLGKGMKEALVSCGIAITHLQRLLRIEDARFCGDNRRHDEEHIYEGHTNWAPIDNAEWLLLEIDNDMLIRESQIDVARAIISPSSGVNSVLQMNMGQGKTSCIVPMAVSVLADRRNLCRLIVPKALLFQTAQIIQSRLGGLVGRIVRHIPFTRRSPVNTETLERYQALHRSTLESGGVMLCLPEHILSFKLSGLQRLADNQPQTAQQMVEIQQWLDKSCRDILDESDFTLSAKTQLIYPSGPQTAVDGHPHRWLVVEELLSLVEGHTERLEKEFPDGVEVVRRHGGYPIIYFLRPEPEDFLNELLVNDVCEGRLSMLQLKDAYDRSARGDVEAIIRGANVTEDIWQRAIMSLTEDSFRLGSLHLLRGLISQRIILLCLKKRWNVQYGLHPERAPIAVPFEAKGVPSQTAEYGHPDTAILLTCLSFYQTGLTKAQIYRSLKQVVEADDSAAQFDRWISSCNTLPQSLQHWNLINPDDDAQVAQLWKHLRVDRNILNDYMNSFVFPVHAKQFSIKLQASGWDIPLMSNEDSLRNAEHAQNVTTGFSGTNDNKRMLPETIKQDDLPSLVQTNAEVLCYLMQDRNMRCIQATDWNGHHLTEEETLRLLHREKIRILIDAGAHILEMNNYDVAGAWLDIDTDAKGAVYFGKNNDILVRAKFQKTPMPLLASPFAENLESCVIYIDEGHTRGTDLKLPVHARGAVTLSLGQTKDQTVQAAMRLRQLGSTQSVTFVAPPEVYRSILDLRTEHTRGELIFESTHIVTSVDVVRWLLEQSCKFNEQMMPLHIAQGLNFCHRTNALWKHPEFLTDKSALKKLLGVIQLQEHQTLEQLYSTRFSAPQTDKTNFDFTQLQRFSSVLDNKRHTASSEALTPAAAFMEVEQEREVEFEVEQVREKQSDMQYTPRKFPGLAGFIKSFVVTGRLEAGGPYLQAFEFIGMTKIGRKFKVKKTASRLFVSREFANTTVNSKLQTEPDILRPVEWVLWSPSTETALVIISEELESIMPMLRDQKKPCVWLLCYAAPVTRSMQSFNSLVYYTIPSWTNDTLFPEFLAVEIGIVAGRLYFNYSEYKYLLFWLGIVSDEGRDEISNGRTFMTCGFPFKKALNFLQEWLTYRRQTLDILHTPMGFVCQRRSLYNSHSFFASNTSNFQNIHQIARFRNSSIDGQESDDNDNESVGMDDGLAVFEEQIENEGNNLGSLKYKGY
ncbi:hypothetical protein TRIATDRAFT_291137 [Trichoderma atroviride IMI 206040]|uniref:ubiquitinyl hydrolase 1 n=1 Tax=Hypocrea atroviridis (strain ATCC 20476 / IMI 206040) TaxID=452589 RepID=G9NQJ2_HYPAI|nr:uncharacterized protein TRIATDRAFT_291137 [Trichoderma atroviride IMI 206040]EHK46815.1 hypothetical protein TRIATDRAFT_291137 [Trichoderma atroviride IMI 206040]